MALEIQIDNLDKVTAMLAKFPERARPYYAKAINAALATISKTGGRDDIMQFKTARENRTGLLQQSFDLGLKPATADHLTGTIGPTVKYAAYVEYGTPAHLIRVRNARVLANKKTGQVFGPVVHHPGTAANPFMERIVAAATGPINELFAQATELIVKGMAV